MENAYLGWLRFAVVFLWFVFATCYGVLFQRRLLFKDARQVNDYIVEGMVLLIFTASSIVWELCIDVKTGQLSLLSALAYVGAVLSVPALLNLAYYRKRIMARK
ncbi:MAG: hypothetical protein RL196_1335 [Actinomycetota bacterium]|jgi:hypothetical protein